MDRGKFIVFEGIDGCGKSTALTHAKQFLEDKGLPVSAQVDPGSTDVGMQIRKVLLDNKNANMCREAELLLYVAARSQLLSENIEPAVSSGVNVLCDRYNLSTEVYQYVFGDWKDDADILRVCSVLNGRLEPDWYILYDVPVNVARERSGKKRDRMESKSDQLFEAVRQRYLDFQKQRSNIYLVDATRSIEDVAKDTYNILESIFKL